MAHPPAPGPTVQPNFLPVMEAVVDVSFPISKRDLLDQVGTGTVLFQGRNVSLRDIVKGIHDDEFDTDAEFLDALARHYSVTDEEELALLDRGNLEDQGDDPWVETERAGPIESGRRAMVRSASAAEDER